MSLREDRLEGHLRGVGEPARRTWARLLRPVRRAAGVTWGEFSASFQRAVARAGARLLPLLETVRTRATARLPVASLIVSIVTLVGCGLVGAMYLQQQREADALRTQVYSARRQLRSLGTEASREAQLENVRAELAAAREDLPTVLGGVETLEAVLGLAREVGVEVTDLKMRPGKGQKTGQHSYVTLSIGLQMEGGLLEIQTFLDALESGAAGAVSLSQINVGGIQESPVASLNLSAYSRP